MVDVLNYFCSVQKEEYKKARYVGPAGYNNTVLLPQYDWYVNVMNTVSSVCSSLIYIYFTFLCWFV